MNYHWLIWSLCLLIDGMRRGLWSFDISGAPAGRVSPIALVVGARTRPIVMVGDARQGATRLVENGVITPAAERDTIIIYPHQQRPGAVARKPRRTLTIRGAVRDLAEVYLDDIYEDSNSDDEDVEFLRMEVA